MTSAVESLGTLIKAGNGASPEVFAAIAEVTNIGTLEEFLEFIEVTHHQSTMREFIPTISGMSDLPIEGNALQDEATQGFTAGLRADLRAKTLRNFQLVFNDGDQAAFSAYVSRFSKGPAPIDGKLPFSATLKISGLVTWS